MNEPSAVFRTPEGERAFRIAYDETAEQLVPAAERLRIPTASGVVHGLATGHPAAPPVILLHGSGATSVGWAAELLDLGRDHRAIALDLPGEPASEPGSRLPLTPGTHAAWLTEVLTALGIERPVVVGESLGGWVALDFATRVPEAAGAVLLLSSSGLGPRRVAPLVVAGLLGVAGGRGRAKALRYLTGPHPARADAAERTVSPLTALALTTFAHFSPRTDALPVFDDETLARASSPMRIVYGARDRMLDAPVAASRARKRIRDADVVLMDGVGHLIPDRADAVGSFVRIQTAAGEP